MLKTDWPNYYLHILKWYLRRKDKIKYRFTLKICKADKQWSTDTFSEISFYNLLRYNLQKIKNCKTQIWSMARRQTRKCDKVFSIM